MEPLILARTGWRKSSYSNGTGDCVEVAPSGDVTAVRDSKDPNGPALVFAPDDWRRFLGSIRSGELHR